MFPKDINIKSVIADSTSHETYTLFDDNMFDIIVDDGLHTLTGIRNTFSQLKSKIKNTGIYVIEDIPNKDRFLSFMGFPHHLKVDIFDDISGEFIAFIQFDENY
jgi:hypothetical protein